MKLLITLVTFLTVAVSAQAGTSQILGQDINLAHLNPSSFRGGVVEMNDEQIKIALFIEPSTSTEIKELVFSGVIYDSSTNDCNETTYFAKTLQEAIITVTDRSAQTCDDVILYPIVAQYVTFDGDNEIMSTFKGSNFISLSKPTGKLKLGTTLDLNYGTPTIMRAANKNGLTVPIDNGGNGFPVILPILFDK